MGNYEVLLLPALYVLSALAVAVTLLRGITRGEGTVADDGLKTYRWAYSLRRLRVPYWYSRSAGGTYSILVPTVVLILTVAALGIPALVVTPPGHRAAIYSQWGGIDFNERPEGLSFVVPYLQTPHQVNVRSQKIEIEAFAQTADLQEVTVKASANYHVIPGMAADLYDNVGSGYEEILIAPAFLQRLDAGVGKIEAEFFASSRDELAAAIVEGLTAQLFNAGIIIEYVNIEDALFQSEFILAVQNKVIAKQNIETELRNVEAAKNVADQVVRKAEGDATAILKVATAQAQANDLLDASLTGDVLKWTRILQWNGALPTTLLGLSDTLDVLLEIEAD